MSSLSPWAKGPFELLVHAEGHWLSGDDFDRRIALISYDDAIEVAISTYLTLNPIQRGGREYKKVDVEKWLNNYPSKLDFLGNELNTRNLSWVVEKTHIVWVHDHRNEQYHGGRKGTPEKGDIKIIREAALWIFSFLFEVKDVENLLTKALVDSQPPAPPQPKENFDKAIDGEYGMVVIGGQSFYVSEALFAVDYEAYKETGERLVKKTLDGENKRGSL